LEIGKAHRRRGGPFNIGGVLCEARHPFRRRPRCRSAPPSSALPDIRALKSSTQFDLVVGYNKANRSPILRLFLSIATHTRSFAAVQQVVRYCKCCGRGMIAPSSSLHEPTRTLDRSFQRMMPSVLTIQFEQNALQINGTAAAGRLLQRNEQKSCKLILGERRGDVLEGHGIRHVAARFIDRFHRGLIPHWFACARI
jgi:hypothetical protein